MRKLFAWIVPTALVLWILFGSPASTIANWLWPESAAPWETVNAFYYPDATNLAIDERELDIGSVELCRDWIMSHAAANDDPNLERGDYECGVGCKPWNDSNVTFICRLTIR